MASETMQRSWQKMAARKGRKLGDFDYFLLGAISKTIATVVTYPLITVKTRMQAKSSQQYNGVFDVLLRIFQEKGVLGYYSGIESKIVQSVLTSAFLFWAHRRLFVLLIKFLFWLRSK